MDPMVIWILFWIVIIVVLYAILRLVGWLANLYSKNKTVALLVSAALILSPYLAFKYYEKVFYLEHIPLEMCVSTILYNKTESWGFGPGGNETGVVAFALPESVARTIDAAGKDYFFVLSLEDIPRNKHIRNCGKWEETPVFDDSNRSFRLSGFLNRYGFGIDVDKNIEKEIDLAMSRKGSYFTGCRGGAMLIVAPKIQKVFYIYAG